MTQQTTKYKPPQKGIAVDQSAFRKDKAAVAPKIIRGTQGQRSGRGTFGVA